jgi:hypothetical protein
MAQPTSQKADVRHISFRLTGGSGADVKHTLVIRPEELTRNDNALQTPYQTFNGAFLDDFGPGLSTIQISGHTGWGQGARPDGAKAFKSLYDTVWTQWHRQRLQAVQAGKDPSSLKLIFIDQLDGFTVVVAPGGFVLKRSKSRPLLSMFNINMTVLADQITLSAVDPLTLSTISNPASVLSGIKSLQGSIKSITAAAANVRGFISANLVQPIQGVMNLTSQAMGNVVGLVNTAEGIVGAEASQMAGIAGDLAHVGRNVFATYNAVANIPDFLAHEVSAVTSDYENAFCVLKNAFRKVNEYPDYDGLYGASVCSSTIGGSPPSLYQNLNPWEYILPSSRRLAAVTPNARTNINAMLAADPVLSPMSLAELEARTSAITRGVQIL